MTTFLVTTLEDTQDGTDGLVSLREAILAANLNLSVNEAPAGEETLDTITFDPSLAGGTLRLTQGLLEITGDTAIDGDIDGDGLPDITISGDTNGDDPTTIDFQGNTITDVFAIDAASQDDNLERILNISGFYSDDTAGFLVSNVSLNGLVVTGSTYISGAGISALSVGIYSNLTLSNSSLSGNNSTSILSNYNGSISLENVLISNTRTRNTIYSSTDGKYSSPIYAQNLTIYNSTAFRSVLLFDGDTDVSLTNLTISGVNNADRSGLILLRSGPSLSINHATIAGNTATAIIADSSFYASPLTKISIRNSIFSGNSKDGVASEVFGNASTEAVASVENSIFGPSIGTYFADIDPSTGRVVVADNGGPLPTVALRTDTDNPAIDIGLATMGLAFDARGVQRYIDFAGIDNGGFADAGAVEMRIPRKLIVTTAADELDSTSNTAQVADMGGASDLSLREALFLANANGGPNEIGFDPDVFDGQPADVIRLVQGLGSLVISSDVEIDGDLDNDGRPDVTVSGDSAGDDATTTDGLGNTITATAANTNTGDNVRVLLITQGDVAVDGLVITGGVAAEMDPVSGDGGGIALAGDASLTLLASSISGNSAFLRGGGIAANYDQSLQPAKLTIEGSTISGNAAREAGGGVNAFYGNTRITNSTLSDNRVTAVGGDGGAFFNSFGGQAVLTGVTVAGNSSAGSGGGIENNTAATLDLRHSTVTGNTAAGTGGGVANSVGVFGNGGPITITDSIVLGNTAGTDEETSGTNVTLTDSLTTGDPATVFAAIDAGTGGGALADNGGTVQTVALLGSAANPALDAGARAGTDARGELGAVDLPLVDNGGASDLGAFELQTVEMPRIATIERLSPAEAVTADDELTFRVTFSEAVDTATVGTADFAVTGATTATATGVAIVDATTVTVTVGGGDLAGFDGTVGLAPSDAIAIELTAGGGIFPVAPDLAEAYTVDNTPPVVVANTGASVPEGGTVLFDATLLAAIDTVAGSAVSFVVTDLPDRGTLFLDANGSMVLDPGDTAIVAGSGIAQSSISSGLLGYVHDGSETTADGFSFTVSDGLNTTAQASFAIAVDPVNDPPVAMLPAAGALAVTEDVSFVFSPAGGTAITVSDPDAGDAELVAMLTTDFGTFMPAPGMGAAVSVEDGGQTLVFTGSQSEINAALEGTDLLVTGPEVDAFADPDLTLGLSVTDQGASGAGGAMTGMASVTDAILLVNDPPEIALPGPGTADEGTAFVFAAADGTAITVADPDARDQDIQVTLTALTAGGRFTVPEALQMAAPGTAADFSAATGAEITLTGTLAEIDAALDGLALSTQTDATGDVDYRITVNDLGNTGTPGARTVEATGTVTFDPVNDAPVVSVPGDQTVIEDTAIVFSAAEGRPLSIADIDAGAVDVRATLTVTSGAVAFAAETATVTRDGTVATLEGTLAEINATLAEVTFTPAEDSTETVVLTLSADDLGNTGTGGALTDSKSVSIAVTAVNDPPVASVPGPIETFEDSGVAFSEVVGQNLDVSDVDAGAAEVTATFTISSGFALIGSFGGPDPIPPTVTTRGGVLVTGNGTDMLTFTGAVDAIDETLLGLLWIPDRDFNGPVTYSLSIDDGGATGTGGPLSDTATGTITVLPVNDRPTISVPRGQEGVEDQPLTLDPIRVGDIDSDSLTVRLAAAGRIDLSGTAGLTFLSGDGTNDRTVEFSGSLADINAALDGIVFTPLRDLAGDGAGRIEITARDPAGAEAAASLSIDLENVADPPDAEFRATDPTYVENGPAVALFRNAEIDPVDPGQTIEAFEIRIDGLRDGPAERLEVAGVPVPLADGGAIAIPSGGRASVSASGSGAVVTINGLGLDADEAQAFVEALAYAVDGDDPTGGVRDVSIVSITGSSGEARSLSAPSSVAVQPVNDPPVAGDDAASLAADGEDVLVPLLANDFDVEGDPLTVGSISADDLAGTAELLQGGVLRYRPGVAFAGLAEGETATETLRYTLSDGDRTATGRVEITVTGVANDGQGGPDGPDLPPAVSNSPPVAADDGFAAVALGPISGNLLADNGAGPDSDPDGDAISVVTAAGQPLGAPVTLPSGATLSVVASGAFTYDPGDAFAGAVATGRVSDAFTYLVRDTAGLVDVGLATVVFEASDLPPAVAIVSGTGEDDSFVFEDLGTARRVEGGGGTDSATFPVVFADVAFEPIEGGFRLVPADGAPVELISVERIGLEDVEIVVDLRETLTKLALIYDATFNRMPDIPGLTFWNGVLAAGTSLDSVADAFAASPEFAARNGGLLEVEPYVREVYANATDRTGDDAGIAYWSGAISDGTLDRGDLLVAFACSEEMRALNENAIDDGHLLFV